MTTVDWKTEYDDLMDRATAHLENNIVHLKEDIEILRPLIVRDTVTRAGWYAYEGDGAVLVALILKSLEEGWIKPPITVDTMWRVASRFGRSPDFVPVFEEGEL